MIKNVIAFFVLVILITGCQSDQLTQLRQENALLKSILDDPRFLRAELSEINAIINNIDASRRASATDRREIATFAEFKSRLNEVGDYIKNSEQKLQSLEKQLAGLRNETSAYTMMVYALKGEVEIRDEDVVNLSTTLKEFQEQNSELLDSVKLQGNHTAGLYTDIEEKQRKLSALETKLIGMENDFKRTEAEVYYAQGQLLEESAHRVRMAPQKKKQSYMEALELYRKAHSLGKKEAALNISALEQTLDFKNHAHTNDGSPGRKW